MTQPKYKIGDYVWLMIDNTPKEGQVYEILEEIWHGQKHPESQRHTFEYWVSVERGNNMLAATHRCSSGKLFPTKQDLINSL